MFDKWFYIHLGKMCGPVTADELNELAETGGLDEKDLIWRVEASPKDAVRAGKHLIFFLAGGIPTLPPVEESPPLAMPVAPASPTPPAPAPSWLSDLADVADANTDSPAAPSASPLDWLQDVRNAEQTSNRQKKK
jgi:GYF domain 2